MSLAKQNYSTAAEDQINAQILQEQTAAANYESIGAYFARDNIGLPGLAKFFRNQAEEERQHAQKLMHYQQLRGGCVVLHPIPAPPTEWQSAKNAVEVSLDLEKEVNKNLLHLSSLAENNGDSQLVSYIREEFLSEQVRSIEEFAKMITHLNRVGGDGLGLYLFDQNLLENGKIDVGGGNSGV
ncbi:3174_t:CDS:2 [Ambispora leptoticha]|uniref:Ferritin n=1 Tax=Ambispora leptoticha TaxID=144679 RepID=A0A9N9B107_9GLOM|nr:3174_t:CDS:2 [Ambispora leptoticha]